MNESGINIADARPMRVFRWFLVFFILDPLIFGIMSQLMLGTEKFLQILKIIILIAPPILAAIAVYLFILSKKGERLIRTILSGDESIKARAEHFFGTYPYRIPIWFFIGNSGGPVLLAILGLSTGVLNSWESALYSALTGLFEAVIFSFLLYYITRVELYHLSRIMAFEPLSIFMKISVPIIALMMGLLIVLNVTIYKVMYSNLINSGNSQMKKSLNIAASDSTSFFRDTVLKLESSITAWGYSRISPDNIKSLLERMRKMEGENIEVFFGGDNNGITTTDSGSRVDISDRDYFIRMKKEMKAVFSGILTSRATGVKVIVLAVPHLLEGGVNGMLGATIRIDSVNRFLKKHGENEGVDYIMTAADGTVLSSTMTGFNEKVFGRDIIDDGKKFINTSLFMSQYGKISETRLDGADYMAMTAPVDIFNGKLTLLVKKSVFFKEMNRIILTLSIMLISIFSLVSCLLFIVAYRIALPIRESIKLLGGVAEGDFSSSFERVFSDEMGNLADALNRSILNVRNMLSTIMTASENLTTVINEISSGNQNLSQRTAEQASALEEIASSIEEASASINQNAENSEVARRLVDDGARKSEESNTIATSAVESIREMSAASKKISDITSLINGIAFQTNLLALNAAVEAARAGEQGRGFAVVAGEVRNLAQRSGGAARDIEELIKNTIKGIDTAARLVENTGAALAEIAQKSGETVKAISEITAAGFEQKQGINQINLAVDELDKMTQQNAALVEEIASSSEEMSGQAMELKELIGRFRI